MNNFSSSNRFDSFNTTGMPVDSTSNLATQYVCGSKYLYITRIFYLDCGSDNEIKPKENIQCKECNGRIFYKKRTRRVVQYEAR
jgi:DNA-directed RNA polymerase subunit RPC12/RpoP